MKLKCKNLNNKYFTIIYIALSAFFICFIIELLNENIIFNIGFNKLIFNFLLIGCVYLFFISITNKLRISLILSNILLFGVGFSNYSVTSLRGTPLSLLDILSVNTGLTIADTYTLIVTKYLIYAILCFTVLIFINLKINYIFPKSKKNLIIRIITISIIILLLVLIVSTRVINIFNLHTDLWDPTYEYKQNGFLASFIKQINDLNIRKPEGYSLDKIESIYSKTIEEKSTNEDDVTSFNEEQVKPNIIVIMNESFSDMSVHYNFGTSEDYIPYFRSLWNNSIHGYTHSSVYGGKTPNSEWEFLTNNSMALFSYGSVPYQQYIKDNNYSLVSTLENQGYSSLAIHSWYPSSYRRGYVYSLFGFNSFIYYDDLKTEFELIRNYPSDLSTYKVLTKQFEERNPDEPFFNFTVTMQNHSGYDYEGEEFNTTVFLTDLDNCPRVEQYLSLIKQSDEALKYLINYFNNVDEPTIILFFGDHQPPYIEEDFLNYINQDKTNSLEDAEKEYLTPYFIWANYDLDSYDVPDISLNYLSILLLDLAGLNTTPYQDYLRNMQKEIPVITGHGYMDKNRIYHDFSEENEYTPFINDYEILEYNNMFGKKNVYKKMFEIQ